MASRDLKRDDGQRELALTRRAEPNSMPVEIIRRQKNAAAALQLAIQSSGLDDSEVAQCLAIDAGYFSRIKKGDATLQADLIQPFCYLVNNTIYPEWMAFQIGCTLVQIQSEAERRAALATERAEKAEERLRYVEGLMLGKVAA